MSIKVKKGLGGGAGGGGGIPTTVIDTIWFGTQEEYDLIDPKAAKTLYLIQEENETPVTLNMASPRGTNLNPINRTVNIEPAIREPNIEEENEQIEEEEPKEETEEQHEEESVEEKEEEPAEEEETTEER